MEAGARVAGAEHLGAFQLRITFSDDLVRELDFDGVLQGGFFAELEEHSTFAQASVDEVAGTICWPNGVDLDPDVFARRLREPVRGRSPRLLRQYRLRPTG